VSLGRRFIEIAGSAGIFHLASKLATISGKISTTGTDHCEATMSN
jgi:hypothetical protein